MVKKKVSHSTKKGNKISQKFSFLTSFPIKKIILALAIIILAGLVYFKKNWFIAAWVNKQPITRAELNNQLNQQYGKQVLESIINKKLIAQEAKKQNIKISDQEIQDAIGKIEKSLSGQTSLDDALKAQGVTRQQLEKDMRLQLTIEKIVGKDIKISDQEISDYIKQNEKLLTATKEAEQQKEASSNLRQQKISKKFQEWLKNLQDKAKISRFI